MDYKEFFLKNKLNIFLVLILIFAFILRLKYFNINTAVWWDEAEYLVKAKNWAFGTTDFAYSPIRPIFLSLCWAFLYKLGSNEVVLRFITELLPSLGSVFFVYLIGKEFYNKKIGLIASFLASVFWLDLFLTARLLTENVSVFFSLISIYYFWKGFVKKQKPTYIWYCGIFLVLATLTRFTAILLIFVYLIFLLITERLTFLKNKHLWSSILISLIPIIIYAIWNYIVYKNPFPAFNWYIVGGTENYVTSAIYQFTVSYLPLTYFKLYLGWIWLIIFLIGLITFVNLFLTLDIIFKQQEKSNNNTLFVFLWIFIHLIFFIYVYKYTEPRYLSIIAPAMFLVSANGLFYLYDFIKKYNKILSIILCVSILFFGAYYEISQANATINAKKDTYAHLKYAGLWIKDNSNPNDNMITTANQMELTYYSERSMYHAPGNNETDMLDRFKEADAKYLILSWWYPNANPQWFLEYLQNNEDKFKIVQAYFFDAEKKQPAVVIFEINKEILKKSFSS